jgi:hypothetical protein
METTEIIIRENGALTERVIRERDLEAGQTVLDALTDEVTRSLRNVMSISEWGVAHANVGLTDTIWSVPIERIPLNAKFRLINDVLVPVFASSTDLEMPLVWRAPKEVRLVFAVRTEFANDCIKIDGNWLFACDKDNRGYRLPLPNLHDDCLICTGNFDDRYDSGGECLTASLEQFRKSKWNADLMRTVEQSQKFFRFQPTNETFETLPIQADDWTTLCDKVSTAIMERVIL